MPNVDKNAPQVTNSDAAMWRQDHASAIRYIEALLEERETWAGVIAIATEGHDPELWESYADDACFEWCNGDIEDLCRAIAAALKEGNADG